MGDACGVFAGGGAFIGGVSGTGLLVLLRCVGLGAGLLGLLLGRAAGLVCLLLACAGLLALVL